MTRSRFLTIGAASLVVILLAVLGFIFRMILFPFLAAYVVQFALRPFVNFLSARGMKHTTAVLTVFLSTFAIIALALVFIIPALSHEVSNVHENIESYAAVLTEKYEDIEELLYGGESLFNRVLGDRSIADEVTGYLKQYVTTFFQSMTRGMFSLLGLFLNISVIPFATFFFLYEDHKIKKKIISLVPNRYFEITLNIMHRMNHQVGLILRGMLTSVAVISVISTLGLLLIGLDYPILVGVFSGVSNLIPYFGPIAGTVAACLVAMLTGKAFVFFIWIGAVFLAVNLLDNVLVQPIVFSKAANLHPLMVIFLVLAGSHVGGMVGMLLAVPLASLAQVVGGLLVKEFRRPVRPPFSDYTIREN